MSFNYTVEKPSDATYGFSLNTNNYYESKNKGVNSSYAMAKLNFTTDGSYKLYLDCINYAEKNYDFGILSELDKTLQMSDNVDSTNVKKNFKGSSSPNVQTVDYGQIANGSHYIYIKFRKDSSTSSNNDSLQFKVRTEKTLPVLESPTISLSGDILTITSVANATSYKIFSNNNLLTTSTTTTVNLSTLFSESGTYTITVTALADGYLESGPSNAVTYKLQLVTLDLTTLNLSEGTHTIKVKAKGEGYEDSAFSNEVSYTVLPQLEAPTISLNGNLLSSSTVQHATSYAIYSNNTLLTTVNTVSISDFDLSTLLTTAGTYTIYAIAKAANYQDSPHSNEVSYVVAQPMPVKGNLIKIDGLQYRVLSIEAEKAKLLAMFTPSTQVFVSSGNTYENGNLDTYLNTTWYNTLSSNMKTAIIPTTLRQDNWYISNAGSKVYQGEYKKSSSFKTYQVSLKSTSYGNQISRNVYALSVQDVLDYLETTTSMTSSNTTLNNYKLGEMFWGDSNVHDTSIWLRSAAAFTEIVYACNVSSTSTKNGKIDYSTARGNGDVRPAFTIDLSKITWLKV